MPGKGRSLAQHRVEATWVQYPGEDPTVDLALGSKDIAKLSGLFTDESMPHGLLYGSLRVHEDYRGSGAATRLISALAYLGLAYGAMTLYGAAESQHTLRFIRRLAREDAITYYDVIPDGGGYVPLPLSTTQAIQSLELAGTFEPDLENRGIALNVHVELSGIIDPHNLEQPVETNTPLMPRQKD